MRKNKIIVAPSLLAANFLDLRKEMVLLQQNGIKYLHFDVMDGHFVPNLSFGIPLLESLKPHFDFIYDVHLMISNPLEMVDKYIKAGADIVTFHFEAFSKPETIFATIKKIKERGVKAGISIKPNTPVNQLLPFLDVIDLILIMSVEPGFGGQSFMPSSLDKIKWLKNEKVRHNYHYLIEVDGGINTETGKLASEAGVDILVAGSFLFGKDDISERIKGLENA